VTESGVPEADFELVVEAPLKQTIDQAGNLQPGGLDHAELDFVRAKDPGEVLAPGLSARGEKFDVRHRSSPMVISGTVVGGSEESLKQVLGTGGGK
jgi:hypothetical protein